MGVPEEVGRTTRLAMDSWAATFRLCVLLTTAAIMYFVAINRVPLIMW